MLIVGTLLVGILYGVIRRSPRRWWFYFWLASIPIVLLMFFLQPIVVDPSSTLSSRSLARQPVLVSEIQKVVHRGGMEIPADRMFVMNASSKTTGLNAYVTGFGASKRVVVWDNTIAKATVPETLFVFGHEMGHYVLLHIPKEMAIISAILLFLLYLGYRLSNGMLARWGAQWGIRDLQDWASLPVLLFVITLLAFLATPVFNGVSRHFEARSRSLRPRSHPRNRRQSQPGRRPLLPEKRREKSIRSRPQRIRQNLVSSTTPPAPSGVHFVATYNPWSSGEEPKYVK